MCLSRGYNDDKHVPSCDDADIRSQAVDASVMSSPSSTSTPATPIAERTPSLRPQRPTRSVPKLPPEALVSLDASDILVTSSPVAEANPSEQDPAEILTPLRAHYLKKYLIQLEFERELDAITSFASNNTSTLSYLGPPFSPPPKDAPPLDLPFLRYIFRQFVLTFPFMASAPKDFYSDKLQPFLAALFSRNLSATSVFDDSDEGSEQATRMKTIARVERNLSLFLGAATKLVEHEEVVRLSQADLDRLETLAKKREARNLKNKEIFEVNIVGVRTVIDKGRVRSRAHEVRAFATSGLLFVMKSRCIIGIHYSHSTVAST